MQKAEGPMEVPEDRTAENIVVSMEACPHPAGKKF